MTMAPRKKDRLHKSRWYNQCLRFSKWFCLFVFGNWVRNRYYSARFLGCNNNTPFYIKINYYEHIIPFLEIDTRQVNDNNNISVRHRYVTSYDDYLAQCSIISYLNELRSVAPAFGFTPEAIDRLAATGFSAEEIEEYLYCGYCGEV